MEIFGIAAGPPIHRQCSGDLVLHQISIWQATYISRFIAAGTAVPMM
jgi:hypothetical protein